MPQYLYINTANRQKSEIAVIDDEQQICSTTFSCEYQFQIKDKLLKMIDKILIKNKLCPRRVRLSDHLDNRADVSTHARTILKFFDDKLIFENLAGIIVVNKSKEITSLRIGVAIANAMAYCLNIPVLNIPVAGINNCELFKFKKIKKFKPVIPEYEINPMLD